MTFHRNHYGYDVEHKGTTFRVMCDITREEHPTRDCPGTPFQCDVIRIESWSGDDMTEALTDNPLWDAIAAKAKEQAAADFAERKAA